MLNGFDEHFSSPQLKISGREWLDGRGTGIRVPAYLRYLLERIPNIGILYDKIRTPAYLKYICRAYPNICIPHGRTTKSINRQLNSSLDTSNFGMGCEFLIRILAYTPVICVHTYLYTHKVQTASLKKSNRFPSPGIFYSALLGF
jgi:hypothetical protein